MTESGVNVLEIPEADEDRINMDKENIPCQIVTNKSAELDRGASYPRTPLQSVNQDRDGVIRPVYSPITPVLGARSRTPLSGQKSTTRHNRRKTVSGFRLKPSPLNVMNTLLYNKAKELIEQGLQEERGRRKQLEELVVEKDEQILRLKAEVNLLSGRPVDASTLQDTSILQDDMSVTASCKFSGVDYSKRTKDELLTELEAFEMSNSTLRSNLASLHQKYQLLEVELVDTRTVRDKDTMCTNNALEQAKVSLEQRIADLLACQSQLTQEVSEREKEVASCRSELQQREKEVTILNRSLAMLRDDLSVIYEQKQQETELCNEYRSQRQKDIERLQELDAKLDEFAQIRPNIIRARLAQANFATVIRKAHQTVLEKNRAVAAEREEFLKQKVEWLKWKDEKEQSLAALQEECDCIEEVKQRQGVSLQKDVAKQLSSAESRIDGLLKQIVCLESSLENEKRIKHDVAEKLNLAEKQATNLNDQMAADVERHELEVTNLQRTLDMREHEIDELTKESSNYKRLVTHMKTQATKHLSIISKVTNLEMQIELMEKDKTAVVDEMLELRKKSTELQQLTADHQALGEKTQSLETCLIEKEQQIRCKEAELSSAVNVVELLFKHASSLFDKLTSEWQAWNKISQGVKLAEVGTPSRRRSQVRTPVTSARRRSRKSFGAQSFIYQILSASKQNPVTINTEQHGSKTIPVLKMYESTMGGNNEQDHAVIEHDDAKDTTLEPEAEIPQLTIRRSSQDSNCSDGADVVSLHSSSSSSYGERFTSFVDEITAIFKKMESLLHGEVAVAFSQLRNVVKNLESHLYQQQQTHTKLMKEAHMVVRQSIAEKDEAQRKAQVATQRSNVFEEELKEKKEHANQLEALLQNKNEKLIQLSDQSIEIQKLSTELASAQKKCELKDEEIRLLKLSLNKRWQCIQANLGVGMTVVKEMEEEVIALKIQKQKLMHEYADDRGKWEESRFRLEEQRRIDVKNLRKAEEAVCQLDEKIERIRLALQPHLNILETDEKLHKILREIRAFD